QCLCNPAQAHHVAFVRAVMFDGELRKGHFVGTHLPKRGLRRGLLEGGCQLLGKGIVPLERFDPQNGDHFLWGRALAAWTPSPRAFRLYCDWTCQNEETQRPGCEAIGHGLSSLCPTAPSDKAHFIAPR